MQTQHHHERERVWKLHPELAQRVRIDHEKTNLVGHHDYWHVLRVGQQALEIAPDSGSARLASAAGLCHNADRLLQSRQGLGVNAPVSPTAVSSLIMEWLIGLPFTNAERVIIVQAVHLHPRPNEDTDDATTMALKDADRLVNAEEDILLRQGQYLGPMLVVDPHHLDGAATASFRDPHTVLHSLTYTLEWLSDDPRFGVRLPLAKERGKEHRAFLEQYIERVKARFTSYDLPK